MNLFAVTWPFRITLRKWGTKFNMTTSFLRLLATILMMSVLSACIAEKKLSLTAGDSGTFRFASPSSYWKGENIDLIGTLDFPENITGKVPVVVILHGSGGPGSQGIDTMWSKFYRSQGVASFRLDYYTTRGISKAGPGGPAAPQDVDGALRFIKTHPRIDADRIALHGISRGGSIVLSTLKLQPYQLGDVTPKLIVAMYPGCERISVDKGTTDEKVLIIVGSKDKLSRASVCEETEAAAKRLGKDVTTHVIEGAYHGFDGQGGGRTVQFGQASYYMGPSASGLREAQGIVKAAIAETLLR